MNAKKHGALSSPFGFVEIRWETRPTADAARQLVIVWTEHGGPEVKQPKYFGFGSRLVTSALQAYGDVQLKFEAAGLVCCMLVDLNDNSD